MNCVAIDLLPYQIVNKALLWTFTTPIIASVNLLCKKSFYMDQANRIL
jgi:hypothetical protein